MKRIIKLCTILFIVLSLCGCQKQQKQTEDIYIVFTSDVHCGFEDNLTWPSLKAYVNSLKKEHNDVLLVDCGDYLQGGTYGTLSKGQYVVDLMNQMGYDIITIGNHEFDYGVDRLAEMMKQLDAEIILSNVKYSGNRENIFKDTPEYAIRELNGVKVGFVGILTPLTPTSSTPSYFEEDGKLVYDFYSGDNGQELYDKVQEVVDEVRKQGAKYVVALSHMGSSAKVDAFTSIAMIANTEGIDVVFDGHSHSIITEDKYPNKKGEDVIMCSAGTKLQDVGTLIIDTEGNMTTMLMSEYADKDQDTINKLQEIDEKLNVLLSEKVAESDFDLAITDEEGIRMARTREVNLGDLFADAFRYATNAQIGFVNGGGVRATIKAGEITYGDLLEASPFQNTLGSAYATGQQILDFLEYNSMAVEKIYKLDGKAVGEKGSFSQVSGLKYTIDTSVESAVMLDENNMFKGFSSDDRRVKDVYVLEGDEYVPIDKDKTYVVGSSSYILFEPGDGNNILNDCETIIREGMIDIEAIVDYVKQFGVEQYRTTGDRITVE